MMASGTTTTTPELLVPSTANISSENVTASDPTSDASQSIFTMQRFFCRICSQDSSKEALAIFCNCGAPSGFTHVSCLETQLSDNLDVYSCDVCNYIFEVERRNRPILQWTKNKDERHDLIFLIIVTLGFNLIMLPAIIRIFNAMVTLLPLDAFTIISDLMVTTIILVGYFYALYTSYWHIARSWRNLRVSNQKVKLVIPPRHLYEEDRDNNEESVEENVI